MWDWGKGEKKKAHKNCSSHLRKNVLLNAWRNVPGCTRHLLRSRYVIKHKLLDLHFLLLKLMKGRGCSGRHSVLEECSRCLSQVSCSALAPLAIHIHFPPAVFMHFISMSWCDLWWCSGCHQAVSLGEEKTGAITMVCQTHPGVQQREIPVGTDVLLLDPLQIFSSLLISGKCSNKFLLYSSALIQGLLWAKNVKNAD